MTELPGARADWEILTTLARMLGLGWAYLSPAEILREIGRVAPIYAGVTRRALGEMGLQWPLRRGRGWRGWSKDHCGQRDADLAAGR